MGTRRAYLGELRDRARRLERERPDAGRDGIEATRAIVAAGLPSKVLILTTFDLDDYVYAGLRAGASGFLLKDTQPDDLANAICIIAAGEAILAPTVTRRLIGQFSVQPPGPPSGRRASQTQEAQIRDTQIRKTQIRKTQIRKTQIRKTLTDRELDVFSRIATGMSNGEIAASLHLSEGTVKVHVGRILAKLGLRDRVQAVVLAYESTLIIPVTPPDAVSPGHGG